MRIIGNGSNDGIEVLTLDTCMTPRSFAQSGLPRLLGEAGYRISPEGDVAEVLPGGTLTAGKEDIEGERDNMRVYFPDFKGICLLDGVLNAEANADSRERAWAMLSRSASVLTRLARAGGHGRLPLEAAARSGPESIFCGEDGSLFILPPTLYRRCSANAGDDAEIDNRLVWLHPDPDSVSVERSFAFMAAALAYRILSGKNAFEALEVSGDEKKAERPRSETIAGEMRKGRFERSYFAAPTFGEPVVNAIDAALTLKADDGAETELFALFDKKAALSSLADPGRTEASRSSDFTKKRELQVSKLETARKREAFLRKYRGLLSGTGIAILVVAAITGITLNDISKRPNTKGMDADQVVATFYKGVAELDQEWPEACLAKGVKSDYGTFLTNIYVTTKVRESYERNGGVLAPALLFAHGKTDGRSVYGVTALDIQRDNSLNDTYIASFYLWLPSSEEPAPSGEQSGDQMSIYRYKDRLTLGKVKDRWQIVRFEPVERQSVIGSGEAILAKLMDGSAAAEPWAPSPEAIQEAAEAELRGFVF